MKLIKSTLAAMAVLSIASAPALAQTSAAKPVERVGVPTTKAVDKSDLEGGSGILIALLAAAAVIAGIIVIADDDSPTSP